MYEKTIRIKIALALKTTVYMPKRQSEDAVGANPKRHEVKSNVAFVFHLFPRSFSANGGASSS